MLGEFNMLLVFVKKCMATASVAGCMAMFLTGCTIENEAYAKTTCKVYTVENSLGAGKCVCGNGKDVYLCEAKKIYRYTGGKKDLLTEVEYDTEQMACNTSTLYYTVGKSNLYKIDLASSKEDNIDGVGYIYDLFAHGEDIFIIMDTESETGCADDTLVMYRISEDGEWEDVDAILDEQIEETDVYTTMQYDEYTIGGTRKCKENTEGERKEYTRVRTIKAEDGWNYSYSLSTAYEPSRVKVNLNGKLLEIGNEDYIYNRKSYDNWLVVEMDGYGANAGITAEHCTVKDGKIYALYQYGERVQGGTVNPSANYKRGDALICLDPETNVCELIYQSEAKNVQIAGFSVEKEECYLLYDDGVYCCGFDGSDKVKVMDNNSEQMSFEYCDGKLYIFGGNDPYTEAFLGVVE